MSIMDKIRRRQALAVLSPVNTIPPEHKPEMLYIGCVDARLDPIDDIGIEKGKALIFRNIGALVLKDKRPGQSDSISERDREHILATGEIPENVSIGAALEFFINHIPLDKNGVKHIVISGHTDCGGMKACCDQNFKKDDYYLPLYLSSLKDVRTSTLDQAKSQGWNREQTLRELEKAAVRQSIDNLRSYPAVQKALKDETLEIHGWVIDTATQRIAEMDLDTREFKPMTTKPTVDRGSNKGTQPTR